MSHHTDAAPAATHLASDHETDEHIEERTEETQVSHEATGTVSLARGVAAVAMYGTPFLYFLFSTSYSR
ncbi:hypothetical protein ACFXPQ_18550 [Streptomyces lydicus]|uniref:hypothetical protein n=1 Tax=Streptomyces lydicus TaxID=47763 RepID=UPI0036D01ABC